MSLTGFTGWQLVFGGFMLAPVALWQEGLPATLTTDNLLGYAYLCLVDGVCLCHLVWGIERLPAVTLSFLGFLSPLSACVFGYLILGETLSGFQLAGAMAILVSIALITLNRSESESRVKATPAHKPVQS